MPEKLLHYIWKYRLFNFQDLQTTDGVPLQIVLFGEYNALNSGADFENARIVLGKDVLVGNIEIHVNASDWQAHQHQKDAAYNAVVLHVVWQKNKTVYRKDSTEIPQLELKDRVNPELLANYAQLCENENPLPCHHFLEKVPRFTKQTWLSRLAVERLEAKTQAIALSLAATNNHWEATFYHTLARYFGFKTNQEPFEALAKSIAIEILAKQKHNPTQIEALFFGQSGLLPAPPLDEYTQELAQEYKFLAAKYDLSPLQTHQWKYARLRPPNFPCIRIAQFAALINQSSHLFSMVLEAKNIAELTQHFSIAPHAYWLNHYQFDVASVEKTKNFGQDATQNLLINVVIPFYYLYGKLREKNYLIDKAIDFLEELPAEKNQLIKTFAPYDFVAKNALQSQAQIQLFNQYCSTKLCLECNIGISVLKNKATN